MNDTVIIALISLFGTLLGSLGGVVASGKLTNFRLGELEKKVQEISSLIERTYALEKNESISEEKMRSMDRRLAALEKNPNQYCVN